MAEKRIIELTNEKLSLSDGDYTIVDSENGTYKFKPKRIVDAIPAIDTTLTQTGEAADAKAVGDAIAAIDIDTVNNARQLLSENYLLDEEPYLFRASGGDGADRVEECIVGGTVGWNQLLPIASSSASRSDKGVVITDNRDGSYTIQTDENGATADGNLAFQQIDNYMVRGHKYYLGGFSENTQADTTWWFSDLWSGIFGYPNGRKETVAMAALGTAGAGAFARLDLRVQFKSGAVISETIKPVIIDLTTLFGPTIADYIYSLEQSTEGAGVAWFRKYFPEDYYEYSAPTLKSVEGVSAKQIRNSDETVTAIYPLDSSLTLRGIPKLTDGKVWFDGDRYEADGTVERRYGIVDLGTLNWIIVPNKTDRFYTPLSNCKQGVNGTKSNILTGKYKTIESGYVNAGDSYDKFVYIYASGSSLYLKDTGMDGYTVQQVATALSGAYLVYELATPTTESATPYTSIQTLDPSGTEEFVSTGIIPVGHYSKYLENLRSKIEGLPKDFSTLIAPTEATYKATRNYTTGDLLIVDNILYKATANIANGGTITPNTNVTATTLAAVIAALA